MSEKGERKREKDKKQSSALAYIDKVNAKTQKSFDIVKSGVSDPDKSVYMDAEKRLRWTKNGKLVKVEDGLSSDVQKKVLAAYSKDEKDIAKGGSKWPTGGHGEYGTTYETYGTVYAGNTCTHSGATAVCETLRGITLAGARGYNIYYGAADIIIDCAAITVKDFNAGGASIVSGTKWLVDAVKPNVKHPDTLFIQWQDMGVPAANAEFWLALMNAIPDNSRVVACCIGGHGRTGTAICCMIAAGAKILGGGVPDAVTIIKFVRKQHCKNAVETKGQEDYVAQMVAEYIKPGDKDELNRQYALCDEAFGMKGIKGVTKTTEVKKGGGSTTTTVVKSEKESLSGGKDIPFKESSTVLGNGTVESTWVDESDPLAESLTIEEQMFCDHHGDIVNADGQILFYYSGLSEEERAWAKTIPTWGEYIERSLAQRDAEAAKAISKVANQLELGVALQEINRGDA